MKIKDRNNQSLKELVRAGSRRSGMEIHTLSAVATLALAELKARGVDSVSGIPQETHRPPHARNRSQIRW